MSRRNLGEYAARISLVLISSAVAILLSELAVRVFYPISIVHVEERDGKAGEAATGDGLMVADDVLGIRPALGTALYDDKAILFRGSVLSKSPDARKILFIGDSVTEYGLINDGLAALIGSERTSYLNGGVASYNIEQEVELFFRYQKDTKPDVIVHQIHINDLGLFAGVVRVRAGEVKIFSPRLKPIDINAALYRYSHLYRLYLASVRARHTDHELKQAAFESLRRMRDYAREHGIAYHVYIFPILLPLAKWSDADLDARRFLMDASHQLGLEMIDLWPVAEHLIAEGIDPQSRPGDTWHPNQRIAVEAAKYIVQRIPALTDPGSK
jgi:hypothetical protein